MTWIIIALLLALALAAPRYGADSHTSDSWTRERRGEQALPGRRASLRADLAAVWSALARRTGGRLRA
jgi:hypothetical protein